MLSMRRSRLTSVVSLAVLAAILAGVAAAQEAYLYDYVPGSGVYVYDASSTGKLTPLAASPFHPKGQMVGTNGQYFVTADSTYIYAYKVGSAGGISTLVDKIDSQLYTGSECGTIGYANAPAGEFDHTGQMIYIMLSGSQNQNGYVACQGLQTYEISTAGVIHFKGSSNSNWYGAYAGNLPTVTGNEAFAYNFNYSQQGDGPCGPTYLDLYQSDSARVLLYQNEYTTDLPPTPPSQYSSTWVLQSMSPDPTNHYAMAMFATTDFNCQDAPNFGPGKLASYTVDSQGNLTTTNTYSTMATTPNGILPYFIKLDPSGKLLAVAVGTGVAFYRFNGANPITPITGIIGTSGQIVRMSWDADDHLYAQNGASGKVHVYAVTTTGAKELSGSPTVIPQSAQYAVPSRIIVRTK